MKETGEVTLESEYEKVKEIDIDNWEPIRGKINPYHLISTGGFNFFFLGPRPWEEQPAKN